ncbi:two-component system, response regulator YesN [Gracilibacillus ureilyticus]|uniref:Two-component system, response regulator YesN n=1 Tax=Gracilibacillus ureilyticus TaxID=531814 RepID=A0A1H9S3M5_9BACI|nr:response regulator [Gracilibacillus ureilyticus]SER79632.1 two-component system, response regulator YesN [Gracilibacillus ureilyticus]
MYKILLVDDERMILDGISVIIDWKSHQAELIGKAMNGLEALTLIEEKIPDIVITDITMPGLDGIGLVAKASEKYPRIKWVFLSGYNEFEYARQAMKFGVKHYLLKPCNEDQISEALTDIIKEKRDEEEAVRYLETIQQEASKLYEYEYEEIMKRFMTDVPLTEDLPQKFRHMVKKKFGTADYQFVIFHHEEQVEYPLLEKYMKEIETVFKDYPFIGTIIDSNLVILFDGEHFFKEQLIKQFSNMGNSWSMIISPHNYSSKRPEVMSSLNYLINQFFYNSEGEVVVQEKFTEFQTNIDQLTSIDLNQVIVHLKKQSIKQAMHLIRHFGKEMEYQKVSPKIAKGYFIQFYLLLMSKLNTVMLEDRFETISKLENMSYIDSYYQFFNQLFTSITEILPTSRKYSKVVMDLIECIEKEIHNPELSLQWLANNCLYMNPDYLGKIFKKEIGQRFSSYVTNARINKAVEIMEAEEDIKVFELAERLGFGSNPQYFSQLFKRIKGYTPSEVMKSAD